MDENEDFTEDTTVMPQRRSFLDKLKQKISGEK